MKKYKKREAALEDQLHQQYAENDNNRSNIFITFIVGIIALFGFYGYVFVNTNGREDCKFTLQVYLLMSFVTIGILFFLSLLSLFYGYALRRDQLIVYNIRRKRYNNEERMKGIFGELYNPFDKGFIGFLPDFYNLFYFLFFFSEIFILITTIIKIETYIRINNIEQIYERIKDGMSFDEINCYKNTIIILQILLILLTIIFRVCYFYCKYKQKSDKVKVSASVFTQCAR